MGTRAQSIAQRPTTRPGRPQGAARGAENDFAMTQRTAPSTSATGHGSRGLGALLLALALACVPAQASAQFSFEGLINKLQGDESAEPAKQSATAETAAPAGMLGAFGNDVALVERIDNAPAGGVAFLDTVQAGRVIELGPEGELVLSYFNSCARETIAGGRVVVGDRNSSVSGGRITAEVVDCQGATPVITAELGEAGAAVKRVTPFDPDDWKEWTVKTRRPIFKWPPGAQSEPATVTVIHMDGPRLRIVWQTQTTDGHFAYPSDAPPLEVGMPYAVQVDLADGASLSTVLSIDPWLDVADNAANRLVPIGR